MATKIILIAHNLRSAHNIGSLLRTCEGMGVEKLILSGYSPYPLSPADSRLPHESKRVNAQIEKTSLGAQNFQDWMHVDDIEKTLSELKHQGYDICALEQSETSIRLDKFKTPEKIAIIIGNEVEGIEKEVLARIDHIVEIPMAGQKESFNVVQAAAMALYRFSFMP